MTEATFAFYMALVGLAIGSFLNVLVDRLPKGESIVHPPSHCPHCHHAIAFYDLIPAFNYLWLRGRCRYCQAPIPIRLPIVEATTGALFAWVSLHFGLSLSTLVVLLNVCIFIVIFLIDLEHHLILNKLLFSSLPVLFALFPSGPIGTHLSVPAAYLSALEGTGLGVGVMLVIFLLSRGAIGEGDVKLGALMGAAVGFPYVISALWLGFVSAGATALTLIALKRKTMKDMMPFGPFLAAGVMAVLLAGDNLFSWYLSLLSR